MANMVTPKDKYYTRMLETLVDYNDCSNTPLSNVKLRQAISIVMVEEEAEERNIIPDANNVTIDTLCQSPVTTNTQGENANAILTSERRNNSDALAETIKGLTIDLIINDSAYYISDEDDAEGDPKSNSLVDTYTSDGKKRKVTDTDTTNRNSPQKLLINRTLPIIIPLIDL